MEVSTFTKLRVKKFPKKIDGTTPENNFWKKFQNVYEKNCAGAIGTMVCGNKKGYFGFSYGNIVEIYNPRKETILYSLTKFKNDVTSLSIREDGKLLAVGENDGKIQLIETKKKDVLRTFRNHKKAVFCTCFSSIEPILVSGSDDLSLKIFDIPTDSLTRSYQNFHKDYIRDLCSLNGKNFLSSSYDQTINFFDISSNSNKPELVFTHGSPVEAIDYSANKLIFASVGGLECKLWDVRNNKEPIALLSANKKTLTCVRFVSNGERVFTSSLDKMIKVFSTESYQLTHQFKYPSPINSFDLTPENTHLAVGMAEGSVVVKKKNTNIEIEEEKEEDAYKMPSFLTFEQKKRIRNYAYFYRGIYKTPEDFDVKIKQSKSQKLTAIENFLKKFQYKPALVAALNTKKNEIIISLIEELLQRGVMSLVVRKMNSQELNSLMSAAERMMPIVKYQETMLETMNKVIDERNEKDWESLQEVGKILEDEIEAHREIDEVCGCLETIANCQNI